MSDKRTCNDLNCFLKKTMMTCKKNLSTQTIKHNRLMLRMNSWWKKEKSLSKPNRSSCLKSKMNETRNYSCNLRCRKRSKKWKNRIWIKDDLMKKNFSKFLSYNAKNFSQKRSKRTQKMPFKLFLINLNFQRMRNE